MSVQKAPDARDERYLKLVLGRMYGLSDEEIVGQLDGIESPRDLYQRISEDGHPICPKCGTTYADEAHCKNQPAGASGDNNERTTRSSGPTKDLPSASNATPLFREKLDKLGKANEELKYRKEKLQGKQFIQSAMYEDPNLDDGLRDELWKKFLQDNGLEVGTKRLFSGVDSFGLGGGTTVPEPPLPALIGAYLLAGGAVEPLVRALHHKPQEADWQKINELIEARNNQKRPGEQKLDRQDGIKVLAARLALLIRGSVRKGSPPPAMSRDEINIACRATDAREAGMSYEASYEELRSLMRSHSKDLSREQFRKLRNLNLRWPFQQ